LLLVLVLDPFGNVPFFIVALDRVEPARRRIVLVRELLIALAALVAFLFVGEHVLALLQISEPSLGVAGGVILFLIALRMIFPRARVDLDEEADSEPFVVPLAIPYVAGPSALASVMFIMNREPERWPVWLAATVLAWLVTASTLYFAQGLRRMLGRRGLIAVERLMGMVLITLAVQMMLNGLAAFLGDAA
ncbi:MAG TPA: MarC family protein, partial [Candidatus Polarisedimenticolaceae bacterium]|nr:MarC family protein [Candidatus Polarisedimenticolaceae bacterium]